MPGTGAALRQAWHGGTRAEARPGRPRAAVAMAAAALSALAACATSPAARDADAQAVMEDVDAGLELYGARDFALAAERFRAAADGARRCGDAPLQVRAVTAECTSWLRAQRTGEFAECTSRLEALSARQSRPDPGLNTLLALGAVAGGRPLPPRRIPNAVRPFLAGAAEVSR